MTSLLSLIVDDEALHSEKLLMLLRENCPEVSVHGIARSSDEARKILSKVKVDLVFLDIDMPGGSGIDFVENMQERNFMVIFVTGHEEHVLRAMHVNAVDYILKPVKREDLMEAIRRAGEKHSIMLHTSRDKTIYSESLNRLMIQIRSRESPKFLTIQNGKGFSVIEIPKIVKLEANQKYTVFYLSDGTQEVASKNIKEYEEIMDSAAFVRLHRSCIIHLSYLEKYIPGAEPVACMNNGERVVVARRRATYFMQKAKEFLNVVK